MCVDFTLEPGNDTGPIVGGVFGSIVALILILILVVAVALIMWRRTTPGKEGMHVFLMSSDFSRAWFLLIECDGGVYLTCLSLLFSQTPLLVSVVLV